MSPLIASARTRRITRAAAVAAAVLTAVTMATALPAAAASGPCDPLTQQVAADQQLVNADQDQVTSAEALVTADKTLIAGDRAQLKADAAAKDKTAVAADKAKLATDIATLQADMATRKADKVRTRLDAKPLKADQALLTKCLRRPPLWASASATPSNPPIGSAVALAGSAANGKLPYAYAWTQVSVPAGSSAALTGANKAAAAVTPDLPGVYQYQLTVTDSAGKTASDLATFTTAGVPAILSATASNATPPVGALVALVGVGEDSDGDALTWHWTIESTPPGSNAALEHPDASGAAFTPDVAGPYRLRVTLTDATTGESTNASVLVDAVTALATDVIPPETSPVVGQPVPLGATTTGGTAPYTYAWAITDAPAGSTAAIQPPDVATAQFTPDIPGAYQVSLTVTDSAGARVTTDPLLLVATPALPPPTGPTFNVACGDTAGLIQALSDVGAAGLPSDAAAVINLNPEGTPDCTYSLATPLGGSAGGTIPTALPPINSAVYLHGNGATWQGPGADPNADPDPATSFSAIVVGPDGMLSADNLSMPVFHPDKGGAIYNQGFVSLTNCNISNNVADTAGGGIYNDQGFMSLTNCAVNHNWVVGNLNQGGGGVYNNRGWMAFTNSTINNNTVKHSGNGGGITNVAGYVGLTGSSVQNNTSGNVGGGVAGEKSGANSVLGVYGNSAVSSNSATSGGGIWNEGSAFITDSQVNSNTASGTTGGGGIHASGLLFLTRASVSFNQATGNQAMGGGVFVGGFGGDAVTANNSFINYNSASFGGGLAVSGQGSPRADLVNSTQLRGNSASVNGAGAYADGPNIPQAAILNVESSSSVVANKGIGIFGDLAIITFDAATADSNEGAGISSSWELTITNNSFVTSNEIVGVASDGTLSVTNSSISNNSNSSYYGYGGGVIASGSVSLSGAVVAGNTANYGGGLYLSLADATILNSDIVGNSAINGGGIYGAAQDLRLEYDRWDKITMTGGKLGNNTASNQGGGVYNEWAEITLNNVNRFNNKPSDCYLEYWGYWGQYTNGC